MMSIFNPSISIVLKILSSINLIRTKYALVKIRYIESLVFGVDVCASHRSERRLRSSIHAVLAVLNVACAARRRYDVVFEETAVTQ
jgi:hypothetical protein